MSPTALCLWGCTGEPTWEGHSSFWGFIWGMWLKGASSVPSWPEDRPPRGSPEGRLGQELREQPPAGAQALGGDLPLQQGGICGLSCPERSQVLGPRLCCTGCLPDAHSCPALPPAEGPPGPRPTGASACPGLGVPAVLSSASHPVSLGSTHRKRPREQPGGLAGF